jgi:hypothetical protein
LSNTSNLIGSAVSWAGTSWLMVPPRGFVSVGSPFSSRTCGSSDTFGRWAARARWKPMTAPLTHSEWSATRTLAGTWPSASIVALSRTGQQARACLGLDARRGWCRITVRRAAPCLLGLHTAVTLLDLALLDSEHLQAVGWPRNAITTFLDALVAARGWLRREGGFPQVGGDAAVGKPSPFLQQLLFSALTTPTRPASVVLSGAAQSAARAP